MNHFLALRLDADSRDRLAAVASRLQEWKLPAHWVHPDDYHLTVLFIGRLQADEARVLPYAIGDLADSLERPRLRLAGLGAFGGKHEPRVVYAGLTDADGTCVRAHRELSEALDMRPLRDYMPHITVCRPRPMFPGQAAAVARRDWPQLLEAHGLADWGECATTELVLYQSTDRVPRYHEIASWRLLKAA